MLSGRALHTAGLLTAISCALLARPASSQTYYEQTYLPASYNFALRDRFPAVDGLFNAFDYGHAILYETLWRHPNAAASELDEKQFRFITTRLLRRPPDVPLDESAIGPNWVRLAPEIAMMFDWAHMLHRQLYDILVDDGISTDARNREIARAIAYYRSRPELAFSSSPKSMNLMEGQPYSLAFRKRFPRYNGLVWSYHWLQMALYDALLVPEPTTRRADVDAVVRQFWGMLENSGASLPREMPQSFAIAPCFSSRYLEAAIIFDNLHSLHDVVSDILANPAVPRADKRRVMLEAAARYRDNTSMVTTVDEWKSMSVGMGADNMGGRPVLTGKCN